jgi:hypothetical protein
MVGVIGLLSWYALVLVGLIILCSWSTGQLPASTLHVSGLLDMVLVWLWGLYFRLQLAVEGPSRTPGPLVMLPATMGELIWSTLAQFSSLVA